MRDTPEDDELRDGESRTPPRKDAEEARPDRPTDSDEATLVERADGAHSEFIDKPDSLSDDPPT